MTQLPEGEALRQFHQRLTYQIVRELEEPLPLISPEGQRLRGLKLGPDLFLARDLKFRDARGVILTYDEVLQRERFDVLLERFRAIVTRRLKMRKSKNSRLESLIAG